MKVFKNACSSYEKESDKKKKDRDAKRIKFVCVTKEELEKRRIPVYTYVL